MNTSDQMQTTETINAGEVVAGNIAEELSRRGWDYEQLADAAGLSLHRLTSYAGDASSMTMNELWAVSVALDIRVRELVAPGGRGPIPDPSKWGTRAPGADETFDVDELVTASPDALRALTVSLDAINAARGTHHTVETVAGDLGMIPPLSVAEVGQMARHIGGVLMA
ncbi:helix-turn-helix transcriptional regulator [Nocardioides sp.]|uniref:helix-turn-helix domain-containing protein n=1 Tax=Nocardioides sp. TaxID=35761 RepID=UPI002634F546|nr:helix-turn-helix transcriptional regulator [Nocardioides sp.]MCW2736113.1 hypothetical protein [Nocardioides sp.]